MDRFVLVDIRLVTAILTGVAPMKASEGRDATSAAKARLHPEAETPDEGSAKERQLQRSQRACEEETRWLIPNKSFQSEELNKAVAVSEEEIQEHSRIQGQLRGALL